MKDGQFRKKGMCGSNPRIKLDEIFLLKTEHLVTVQALWSLLAGRIKASSLGHLDLVYADAFRNCIKRLPNALRWYSGTALGMHLQWKECTVFHSHGSFFLSFQFSPVPKQKKMKP